MKPYMLLAEYRKRNASASQYAILVSGLIKNRILRLNIAYLVANRNMLYECCREKVLWLLNCLVISTTSSKPLRLRSALRRSRALDIRSNRGSLCQSRRWYSCTAIYLSKNFFLFSICIAFVPVLSGSIATTP